MRLVKEGKPLIGDSPEKRRLKNQWWKMCAEMEQAAIDSGGETALESYASVLKEIREKASKCDLIDELDKLIENSLERNALLTTISSDLLPVTTTL
jgi:hypothetical protein